MKSIHRAVGCAVVLAAISHLTGCGMAPKAEAPTSTEAAPVAGVPGTAQAAEEEGAGEPTTLADAEALLEKARVDLNRLALNEAVAPPAAGAAAPPPPASVQMAPAPSPAPARDDARRAEKSSSASADAAPAAPAKEANACETACKAFSSLSRASDAVCRLDTEGGKRCERARQIREDASHRVASCGCAK
jgi:hypothetical protein